jgi:hypothetical protein
MNAAGCLLMTATPIAPSDDPRVTHSNGAFWHEPPRMAMRQWSGQDIAALTLARDLHDLRRAQR